MPRMIPWLRPPSLKGEELESLLKRIRKILKSGMLSPHGGPYVTELESRLKEMLSIMCSERGARFYSVPQEFAGDNGAMIAWAGILMHNAGIRQENPRIYPRERTDDIDVVW